jgi:hypothetical protein
MSSCPAVVEAKQKKRKLEGPVSSSEVPLAKTIRVVNYISGKVHVYSSGERTLCRMWVCGSPGKPSSSAVFSDFHSSTTSSSSSNCLICFGDKLNFLTFDIKDDLQECSVSDEFEDDT